MCCETAGHHRKSSEQESRHPKLGCSLLRISEIASVLSRDDCSNPRTPRISSPRGKTYQVAHFLKVDQVSSHSHRLSCLSVTRFPECYTIIYYLFNLFWHTGLIGRSLLSGWNIQRYQYRKYVTNPKPFPELLAGPSNANPEKSPHPVLGSSRNSRWHNSFTHWTSLNDDLIRKV